MKLLLEYILLYVCTSTYEKALGIVPNDAIFFGGGFWMGESFVVSLISKYFWRERG